MFLIDDILLAPVRSIVWVARKVAEAAEQERAAEEEAISVELQELYRSLEAGRITESAFDAREKELLDRLDNLRSGGIIDE